jgi:hypothetical protein
MSTITIQPSATFNRGVTIYNPQTLPSTISKVEIAIDRSAFTGDGVAFTGDGTVAVAWTMFYCPDSTASPQVWHPFGGAGTNGGIIPGIPKSSFTVTIPDVGNANRQLAATLAVSGTITLAITATVT